VSSSSRFIRPMHPKTSILPLPQSIQKVLESGWIGQLKIHGHRAQIHVPSDPRLDMIAFNRQGRRHRKELSDSMKSELRRLFQPRKGWNVIDAEWLKPDDKLYVFDFIKREGILLRHLTFPERWKLLPRAYLSPSMETLALIKDLDSCLKSLASRKIAVEGLVFKSTTTPGFLDTSIIRCRRRPQS
jgi:hypothetical protein